MPSASRNANRKRRARRNVTLLKRAVQSEAISRAKTTVVLFAVLSKLGGELEISKTDIDTSTKNLTRLSFVVEPSAVEGNFMVRLVVPAEPGTQETPNAVKAVIQAVTGPETAEVPVQAAPEVSGEAETPSTV